MSDRWFLCRERSGPVVRHVKEVSKTTELRADLDKRLKFLPDVVRDLSWFDSPESRVWTVNDVGILFQGGECWDGLPDVHYIFWDKRARGRESMCLEMCKVVASDAGARGVFSAAPVESRVAIAFARRIGFQLVTIRNGVAVMTLLFT